MFAHVCQYWRQYTSKFLHWFLNYLSKHSSLIICTSSYFISFSSVQMLSPVGFVTPWIAAHLVSLSITNFWRLLKLMSIESVMPYNHLILCCPLLLPPSIFPSKRVFSNESVLHIIGQSIGISASESVLPMNIQDWFPVGFDWLALLSVQGTLNSLLQHHSSKASILRHSAFFTVQLSHPYMTTRKTIALTRRTFVGKVMSLLLNMLSRLQNTCFQINFQKIHHQSDKSVGIPILAPSA